MVPGEALHCNTTGGARTTDRVLKFSEETIKKKPTAFTTRIRQKHCSATFNCKTNCESNSWAEEPLQQVAHCGSTVFTHCHMHTWLCRFCCLPNHALKHLRSGTGANLRISDNQRDVTEHPHGYFQHVLDPAGRAPHCLSSWGYREGMCKWGICGAHLQ